MASNGVSHNGVSHNGVSHNGISNNGISQATDLNSVLSLANKVSELAVLQTHHVAVPQEEFLQAIQRLQIAVEGPAHYVARKRHEPNEYAATLLAIDSGVLQALVDNDRKPLSAEELGKHCNTDPLLITRFMRILTAIALFDEVDLDLYKSNDISEWLARPGQADGYRLIARWILPITSEISSLWKKGRLFQFPDESKGEHNPFIETFNTTQWDQLREDSDLKRAFDSYMPIRRNGLRIPWHEIYPAATELDVQGYSEAHEPPVLVDVGGNTGYEGASFKAANPHIKGRVVIQDLAETLESSVAPKGVERQIYDCFTPQPIKGARAYFMKALLHDFDDAESRRLLRHTVDAMGPQSSLLIDDWVLPDVNAPVAGGTYDIMMLMLLSGMERSEKQWRALLESLGLEVKNIWRKEGVGEGVIEARKK